MTDFLELDIPGLVIQTNIDQELITTDEYHYYNAHDQIRT